MCRKKNEPFKCDYVPISAALVFMLKHKHLFRALAVRFEQLREGSWSNAKKLAWRSFHLDPNYKLAKTLIRNEFNYASGSVDFMTRFITIYRDNIIKK
jgi:hypothetical protein